MRFCPNCKRVMNRNPSSGYVVFSCPCGVEEKGEPVDARLNGKVLGAGETSEKYRLLIGTASFDRTNQLVNRDCPACGLDYMTQIRVGNAEIIIYTCKCGYESGNITIAATTK